MKKVSLAALIAFAFLIPAHAQTTSSDGPYRFELGFNPVSYLRQEGKNMWGGTFSVAMRRSEHLSYVADFSFHTTRVPAAPADSAPHPDSFTTAGYRFGLRYYAPARGKITPFAEVLAGGGYLGAVSTTTITPTPTGNTTVKTTILESSHTGLGFLAGAGADYAIKPWFSWRIVQADYSLIRGGGSTFNGIRIHTGGVFHFGH